MRLHLRFGSGTIEGEGRDKIGKFVISGVFEGGSGKVLFTKVYRTHEVEYGGKWDGQMMFGKWTIVYFEFNGRVYGESGEFELWPDHEEEGAESANELEDATLALPSGTR
ncbi:MAG TPA: hypothetical protein VM328_02485 [Fimbriimonadaceae bacterium]|nr:hypothetical protein [Fimbriimonadaceae bacterium]